jgi:hypothetical protein
MAIVFCDSLIFGYEDPYNAVKLPCFVIGQLDPAGEDIFMLGYQVDGGMLQFIPTPPLEEYGIATLPSGFDPTIFHTLTIVAYTGPITYESASYSFEPSIGFRLLKPTWQKVRQARLQTAPPGHTVTIPDPQPDGSDKRTWKATATLTHEDRHSPLTYAYDPLPINLHKDNSGPHPSPLPSDPKKVKTRIAQGTTTVNKTQKPGDKVPLTFTFKDVPATGTYHVRVLVWDSTHIQHGADVGGIVKSTVVTIKV